MIKSTRGISPVVGAIMMVALVVVLSGVTAMFVTDFEPQEPQPNAVVEAQFYTQYNSETDDVTHYMEVRHINGETLSAEETRIRLQSGEVSTNLKSPDNFPEDGFSSGDVLTYEITNTAVNICDLNTEEAELSITDEPSEGTVYTTKLDVDSKANVDVEGNRVGVTEGEKFTANIEVLGIGASGSGSGDVKGDVITGRVVITDENGSKKYLTPWPDGNPSDSINTSSPFEDDIWTPDANGITYTTEELNSTKSVSVDMRSYKPASWTDTGKDITRNGTTYDITRGSGSLQDDRFWVNSDDSDENNLLTLKNGDTVPKLGESLSWQQSLQDMLQERMNEDGELQLDNNEVVAVYELNTVNADPNGSGDYNDAVVLIEVNQEEQVVTKSDKRHYLYC